MKRRSFVKTGSLASLASLASLSTSLPTAISNAANALPDSGSVDTVNERYYYLKRMLNSLCTELGPRPAGSVAYNRGIRLIADEMKRSLPEVFLDEFKIEQWELENEPSLTVGGTPVEAFPFHGSIGTPKAGARGILKKNDSGTPYSIVDSNTGEKLADISISSYGPAIPSNAYRDGKMAQLPIFGVGKYDLPLLDKAAEEKKPVIAHSNVKIIQNVPSWNAVGTLPGKSENKIT